MAELVDSILDYVHASDDNYAIAVEGEWGSGKTRYFTSTVSTRLKEEEIDLIRVSLFGVKNPDEIYERLASALVNNAGIFADLPDGRQKSLGARLAGSVVQSAAATMANKIMNSGFSTQMGSRFLVDLLLTNNILIVFDDTERRESKDNDNDLFGTINDLIEGHKAKVVLITNSVEGIDAETREKLIWKTIPFTPNPHELVKAIFCEQSFQGTPTDLIEQAVNRANCINARAMLRAKPLIGMLLYSASRHKDSFARNNIHAAIVDLVAFALMTASGRPPAKPEKQEEGVSFLTFALEEIEYEKYRDCPIIGEFFAVNAGVTQDDTDRSFFLYMSQRYPDSADSWELWSVLEQLTSYPNMNDAEVEGLVRQLRTEVEKANFDARDLHKCMVLNSHLSKLGFVDSLSVGEFEQYARRAIEKNPNRAYWAFHKELESWGSSLSGEWKDSVDRLDEFAVDAYEATLLSIPEESAETQMNMDDMLEAMGELQKDRRISIVEFSPKKLVSAFVNGSATEQLGLHGFIRDYLRFAFSDEELPRVKEWLNSIKNELEKAELKGKTDEVRKDWILQSINKFCEQRDI